MLSYVLAQVAVAAAPQQGVISYPASFFATQHPANAAEMIDRVPGFSLDSGSSARGFEGSAGNVLIDGQRPASKSDNLEGILRRLPSARVERIDVIRGGAPGIDMQGKTVIANIVRKTGGGFNGVAAAAADRTSDGRVGGTTRLEASGDWGPRKWELGFLGGKGFDDGIAKGDGERIDDHGVRTPVAVDAEGDILNGQLTGAFETPAVGGKLRLNGRLYSEKYKGEETDRLGAPIPGIETSRDIVAKDETEIGGTFSRKFGDRTDLELVGLRQTRDQDIGSDFTDTSTSHFQLRRESSETIARAVLKYRVTDQLSTEVGGESAVNKLNGGTRLTVGGQVIGLPAANVQVKETRREGFAKAAWRPAGDWTLDATLRYETSEISSAGDVVLAKTLSFLKPRATLAWSPRASTQLRARVEREVGQLNFDDFVASANLNNASGVSVGNPNLNPERAWVGEAALEQRFWKSGALTLTYRHFELSDVVDRGPVVAANGDVFDRPANIGSGTKDEVALEFSLPLERLGARGGLLRGDLTRRWSNVIDPTTRTGREISDLRPIEWSLHFTHDLPAANLNYGFDAFGAWRQTSYRFDLTRTTKLRTWVTPFVEWRPAPDLNVRLEANNITSRGLRKTIRSYPGLRSAGGVATIDDRSYQPGPLIHLRVRKTFGG